MKKRFTVFVSLIIICAFACLALGACVADNRSAYQIAKDNGFMGTEMEWLNSLKGQQGENGSDGNDGINGQDGKDGIDGQDAPAIDIYDLYEAYKNDNPDATFEQFLKDYLNLDYYDTQIVATKVAQSALSVYSVFYIGGNRSVGAGSGFIYKIIDNYAYIMTNYHVVYETTSDASNKIATEIAVFTYGAEYDKYAVAAEFVGGSKEKDVAILRALTADFFTPIKEVELGDSNDVSLGDRVITMGNASAYGLSITAGVVSVDSETLVMDNLDGNGSVQTRVMRTDTAINRGNSGGGLFNIKGELIGIVNAKIISADIENIGYAIPINIAAGVFECVMENDSLKAFLMIEVVIDSSKTQYNSKNNNIEIVETIKVHSINSLGPAYGVLEIDDIIVEAWLNENEPFTITRIFHLHDYLYKAKVNDTLTMKIIRGGNEMTVEAILVQSGFGTV